MPVISALIFDLDNTLIADDAATDSAFREACALAAGHGVEADALGRAVRDHAGRLWRAGPSIEYARAMGIASWEALSATFEGDDPNLARLREWTPAFRHRAWADALAGYGIVDDGLARRLASAFREARGRSHVAYGDTVPVLADLARDYRLALLTNGAPDLQRQKIAVAGLDGRFEVTVVSGELGIGKPDPRIFAHTLAALGVNADAAAMIGDSVERDIEGAKACGIRAIRIVRPGVYTSEEGATEPDARITTLGELRGVL